MIFLEEKVTSSYLVFKLSVSVYLLVSYVISHVQYALSSEICSIQDSNKSQVDALNQINIVLEKDFETSDSQCTRSDWPYYWIYFTNWGWTLLCFSFLFDTTLVILRYRKERKNVHHLIGVSKASSIEKGIICRFVL